MTDTTMPPGTPGTPGTPDQPATTAHPGARISGQPRDGGTQHAITNPATGEALARVGWVDTGDTDAAVAAAVTARRDWQPVSKRERAAALRAIAADLRAATEQLSELLCAETGKRLAEARAEVGLSATYFDWFADAAVALTEEYRVTPQRRFLIRRQPIGVAAALTPWNFPLSIPARKIAPAVAAGCPTVLKPSELTPLSALALTEICERHLPAGVVNVVVGDGAPLGNALIDHPDVDAVSFTGSTRVGIQIAERAARTLTRVTLELGGRAPFLVCEDADTDAAVDALLTAKFRNNGASCISANNVFVHAERYTEVLERLRARVGQLRVGDPRDDATELGPLLRAGDAARLDDHVQKANAAGLRTTRAAHVPDHETFCAPAVVELTEPDDLGLWHEEVFGPVCLVRRYDDEDAVIAEVNEWRQGLGGYVASSDTEHAIALAERLRIGIVGINNGAPNTPEVPFGGFDSSGLGREGGLSGLLEFTEEQSISLARS